MEQHYTLAELARVEGKTRRAISVRVQSGHYPNAYKVEENGPYKVPYCDVVAYRKKKEAKKA